MDTMIEDIAFYASDEAVTYGELISCADYIAGKTPQRSLVLFVASNSSESLAAYVGFLRKRVVPIMVGDTIAADAFQALLVSYCPDYVWCPSNFVSDGLEILEFKDYHLLKISQANGGALHPDLALLLSTSGSTGSQKYVRLSYANVEANARSIAEYLSLTKSDCAITTLPFSYSYGLSIINSHLLSGASIVLTKKTLFEREFWDLLKKREVTSFSGVPYTYAMLKRLRFERMNLPSLRYITQAGGRLGNELHQEFAQVCDEKGIDFFVMYGQTEGTARLAYLPPRFSLEKIGSVGIAIPGGSFSLLDAEDCKINEPDSVGELVYCGRNVFMGYAECRDDLSRADENNGVLKTGDIARFDGDGFYTVVGRKKRFLKIFGNRVNLDEIEQMLSSFGVIAACSGQDDAMKVFVENDDAASIRAFLVEKTGLHKDAFNVVQVKDIPRNDAGKVLYSELEALC